MLREATRDDLNQILTFLDTHAETSMFLRSNLMQHGVGNTIDPYGTNVLLWEEGSTLRGVMGRTNQGNLLCQCPGAKDAVWQGFANWASGHTVLGISGEVDQVNSAIAALGWNANLIALDDTQPLFRVALCDVEQGDAYIRPVKLDDLHLLTDWYADYTIETGLETDLERASEDAVRRAKRAVDTGSVRVMIECGQIVCMVGINARAENIVQIGGVFTPKAMRGRGYASRGLAAYLHELEQDGADQAILFAASESAVRAYEKIGFRQIGHYQITMLKEPRVQESA